MLDFFALEKHKAHNTLLNFNLFNVELDSESLEAVLGELSKKKLPIVVNLYGNAGFFEPEPDIIDPSDPIEEKLIEEKPHEEEPIEIQEAPKTQE